MALAHTLLSATFKNSGDFLIYERSKALLKAYAGVNGNHLAHISMRSLEPHLKAINQTQAIVICGGPGYQSGFYPQVYPLAKPVEKIKPPVFLLGLGWGGEPKGEPEKFRFTKESVQTIKWIQEQTTYISCRDNITYNILKQHGFENVLMTGCPVWYDLDHMGQSFVPPTQLKKIVVTPPQETYLHPQCRELLSEVKKAFPNATRYCVFHRGIFPDKHTPWNQSRSLMPLAMYAKLLGYKVIDASYGTEK